MRSTRFALPFLLATLACSSPAAPVAAQVASPGGDAVDSVRVLRDLSVLADDSMSGRATGTPGAGRARAFLIASLRDAGIDAAEPGYLQSFTWPRGTGYNVVAVVPGRETPDRDVIFITAHYDHLGIRDGNVFNGADDNASGVAALLEFGRRLRSEPLRHTAVLAFVDAEEPGLWGSRALVADPPVPIESIALDVNLDMVARTAGTLWAAGAYQTPALKPILEGLAAEAPLRLRLGHDRPRAPEGDDWTYQSDHAAFWTAGIPFVYFGVEDHPDYHRESDEYDKIDPGEFIASVRTILLGIRLLDAALPLGAAPA